MPETNCKWCDAGNVAELSPHTKTYIHRRDTLDKPCTNPRCPQCGDIATYQTPDGTLWDGSAHRWKPDCRDQFGHNSEKCEGLDRCRLSNTEKSATDAPLFEG